MNILFSLFLLPACLMFSCADKSDQNLSVMSLGPVEGIYEGYRSQFSGQKPATDSTRIKLKVTRLANGKLEILQTSPNEFKYLVNIKNDRFTYDLGLAEAACGVTHISGEGYFGDDHLYLREKSECKNNKAADASFIQLRARKK